MSLKLITAPGVYLVGRTAATPGLGDFILGDATGWKGSDAPDDASLLCEVAGRTCYQSWVNPRPGGNKAYLGHILESQHGSVLEHAVYSFIFTGISRSLSHELVRHRAGMSYSQLSQRYVDESDVAFVVPPALLDAYRESRTKVVCETREELLARNDRMDKFYVWHTACEIALGSYRQLVEDLLASAPAGLEGTDRRKWARQAARSVLPNCAETKVFVTGNARAWRGVIEQRCSRHAEVEIRRLFNRVWEVLAAEAPNLFGDYQKTELPDGTFELTTPHKKV